MTETIATREHDGVTYRAQVHLDLNSYDMKPDGDYFGYVFWVDGHRTELLGKAYSTPDTDFGLNHLWAEHHDWSEILEILKGDRDTCNICWQSIYLRDGKYVTEDGDATCDDEGDEGTHSPSEDYVDADVVDLDYISRGDHDIVNVVTKQDLAVWGGDIENWGPDHKDWPEGKRPTDGNLTEWEAWADGDVYFYTVEKAVDWTTDANGHEDDTMTTWDDVDACHGFYGDEYAAEAALESLDNYAPITEEN